MRSRIRAPSSILALVPLRISRFPSTYIPAPFPAPLPPLKLDPVPRPQVALHLRPPCEDVVTDGTGGLPAVDRAVLTEPARRLECEAALEAGEGGGERRRRRWWAAACNRHRQTRQSAQNRPPPPPPSPAAHRPAISIQASLYRHSSTSHRPIR